MWLAAWSITLSRREIELSLLTQTFQQARNQSIPLRANRVRDLERAERRFQRATVRLKRALDRACSIDDVVFAETEAFWAMRRERQERQTLGLIRRRRAHGAVIRASESIEGR